MVVVVEDDEDAGGYPSLPSVPFLHDICSTSPGTATLTWMCVDYVIFWSVPREVVYVANKCDRVRRTSTGTLLLFDMLRVTNRLLDHTSAQTQPFQLIS